MLREGSGLSDEVIVARDWPGLARNALWILGLGVTLAAASHASWHAACRRKRFGRELGGPAFLIPVSAGLLLVTVSLAWAATLVLERGLWAAMSMGFFWHIFELLRHQRAK